MPSRNSLFLLCAIAGAVLLAIFRQGPSPVTPSAVATRSPAESFEPPNEEPGGDVLPPNHPPIGATAAPQDSVDRAAADSPAIVWKAPTKWTVAPNANAMRLATYRVPAAAGVADEAELTVVHAGGSTEANLQRWVTQFTDAAPVKRAHKTVHGLEVSLLEVSGTFLAGGMGSGTTALPRHGWALEGAVVETPEGAYFFKLTGPSASVRAARADFDALVESVAPVASAAPH